MILCTLNIWHFEKCWNICKMLNFPNVLCCLVGWEQGSNLAVPITTSQVIIESFTNYKIGQRERERERHSNKGRGAVEKRSNRLFTALNNHLRNLSFGNFIRNFYFRLLQCLLDSLLILITISFKLTLNIKYLVQNELFLYLIHFG